MKAILFGQCAVALGMLTAAAAAPSASLQPLRVLYLGDREQARAQAFVEFLRPQVHQFETTPRNGFNPKQAQAFDVVLLDWGQSAQTQTEWKEPPPLGPRENWTKPTVLLGSAGLNLAVVWKVRGGSG